VRCALCCEAVQPEASTSVLQLGFDQLLLVLDDGSACINAMCAGSAVAALLQLRLVVRSVNTPYYKGYLHSCMLWVTCRHSGCAMYISAASHCCGALMPRTQSYLRPAKPATMLHAIVHKNVILVDSTVCSACMCGLTHVLCMCVHLCDTTVQVRGSSCKLASSRQHYKIS
jgi:hypothetical protein